MYPFIFCGYLTFNDLLDDKMEVFYLDECMAWKATFDTELSIRNGNKARRDLRAIFSKNGE